ncbi:MAG: AAA family ATPase [Candidatus Zixiibacteriota bacterium]
MLIGKCEINRYGKLNQFSTSFSTGINVIKGPNEAGKSTLVDALTDALFENPKTQKKDVKARTSWGSDKAFHISLDFESEGLFYSLTKDFDSGEVHLLKKSSGETLDDKKRVDLVVSESLGLSNRDIFLATSCIRQDEMARIAESPDAIKDRLEALITGGKEEVLASKTIDKLSALIKSLKKEGHKHKGQIQRLEDEKSDVAYELDKARREIETIGSNRTALKEIRSSLDALTEDLKTKETLKKNARLAADATESVARLEARFGELSSRINNIKNSEAEVGRLRGELSKVPRINPNDIKIAEEQVAQRTFIKSKKETAEKEVLEHEESVRLAKPSAAVKVLSFLSLFGCAGSAFYWYQYTSMTNINFLIGSGAALLLFATFSILWSKSGRNCARMRAKYEMSREALQETENDLKTCRDTISSIVKKYEFSNVDSLRESFEKRSELEIGIKTELRRYEEHLNNKTLAGLEDDLKVVTRELAVENEKLREYSLYTIKPEKLAEIERSLETMEEKKKSLALELTTVERHLEFAESGMEHQASLEERYEELEVQLSRRHRQLLMLEKTREFIEKARKDVLTSSLKLLDDETSDILCEVTGGKYTQVRFDRQSLKFEVFSNEMNDWAEPENCLSRGTIDQLYLAARLAMVKIISEDRHPVIILDDPFVTFDKERRDNALTVLKRLADRYQIFLLTCHDHYDNLTPNVISMA